MAQSRLEKVGTIYSRVTSLIKAGAMKEESKPLWVDLYKAFPPKYEPRYDRPGLTTPIRQIFYKEDKIRARFHDEYKYYSVVNMLDTNKVSKTEQFLLIYKQLEREGIPEEELYDKTVQEFLSKVKTEKIEREAMFAEQKSKTVQRRKDTSEGKEDTIRAASEQSTENLKQYKPVTLSMDVWKLFEKEKDEQNEKDDEKKSK